MSDYKTDLGRFLDERGLAERDSKDVENRKFLSDRYGIPFDTIIDELRKPGQWMETEGPNGETISTDELRDAPPGLTDLEFAEWAVQRICSPRLGNDMAAQNVGDRIIAKREDGHYDVLQIRGRWEPVRQGIPTLDEARLVARDGLTDGGKVWYRHHGDPPDQIEPL